MEDPEEIEELGEESPSFDDLLPLRADRRARVLRLFLVQEDFHTVVLAVDPERDGRNAFRLSFSRETTTADGTRELRFQSLPWHVDGVPLGSALGMTSKTSLYLGTYELSTASLYERAWYSKAGKYSMFNNNCREFCKNLVDSLQDVRLEDEAPEEMGATKTQKEANPTAISWAIYIMLFVLATLIFLTLAGMFQTFKKDNPAFVEEIKTNPVLLVVDNMMDTSFKV